MMRRASFLAGVTALVLCCAPSAFAGRFSPATRIPATQSYWQFAINRGGSAFAITGSQTGALVYALGSGSRFEQPATLAVAGEYPLFGSSEDVSVDGDRLTVGLNYTDDTAPAEEVPHGSPGCWRRAAVVSWRLGELPPLAQTLTPKLGVEPGFQKQPGRPAVFAGRKAITAIWSVGGDGEQPEPGPATLREGFGPLGGRLHVQTLARAASGIQDYVLSGDRHGRPIAAWLSDNWNLHVVSGTASGALHHPVRRQAVAHLGEGAGDYGFSADGVGDIVFWYLAPGPSGRQGLFIRTSTGGRGFTRPRLIAQIRGSEERVFVRTGEGRSVLALWEWRDRRERVHLQAAFGGIDRPFAMSPALTPGFFGGEATGFVSRGEAVVIFRREVAGFDPDGLPNSGLEDIRARSEHSFGPPQPLFPRLKSCGISSAGELPDEAAHIPTSADGYAILDLVCEGGGEYIARYAP